MNISIFGLGYVGAVSLACLARDGHQVVGVDLDQTKLDLIASGKTPIIEEGMQELMAEVAASGRVDTTTSAAEAIAATDLSFICVGTPPSANGSQDLTAIERVSEQMGEALKAKNQYHVFVIRSTVFPGTLEEKIRPILEQSSGLKCGPDFGLCFQPEFLREGSSIKDYDKPPFTVIGGDDERALGELRTLFGHLPCDFITTDIRTAEMVKYTCNIFHAVKITFANEIARLSQSMQVDSHAVMDLVCRDKQLNISPAYMKPGFAYGGSCLPKDLKAMLYVAKHSDTEIPMLANVSLSNDEHIKHAIAQVEATGKRNIAMIGLSFKSGTDDLRESPLVTLAEYFIGKGKNLKIYDPEVNLARLIGANKRYIEGAIPHIAEVMTDDCAAMLADAEVIILGLTDAEAIDTLLAHNSADQTVLDLVNMKGPERLKARYQGVCW